MFYSSNINNLYLDEQESFHAIKVLRLKAGDELKITNGKGKIIKGIIIKADSRKCEYQVGEEQIVESLKNYDIHIGIAPTKNNERNEWFVEKSTELGIDKITFLTCERSERKVINVERLSKVAVSAMKQSLHLFVPEIKGLINFKEFINIEKASQKYIAHLEKENTIKLNLIATSKSSYVVLIGPEGDFTKNEIVTAQSHSYISVSLGRSRLRTETAGIAACHVLNLLNDY